MEIIENIDQLSEEWFKMRIGSIGGSSIATAVAKGSGATRNKLLYRMAGEILSGEKYEGYSNDHMKRGIDQEPEARSLYEFMRGVEVDQVALIRMSEHKHDSPDGLVGKNGRVEIKCVIPSVHIETIIQNKVPPAYRKQTQWGLSIDEVEWSDFISYSPTIVDRPIFVIRESRNEKLIKELHEGADKFIEEMLEIVKKIRS